MNKCTYCGTGIDQDQIDVGFCHKCGAPISETIKKSYTIPKTAKTDNILTNITTGSCRMGKWNE